MLEITVVSRKREKESNFAHKKNIGVLLALLALGTMFQTSKPAQAATPTTVTLSPVMTNTYYIDRTFYPDPVATAQLDGKNDALNENNTLSQKGIHCTQGQFLIYTVLDFGAPTVSTGILNWHASQPIPYGASYGDVSSIADAYALGWYQYSLNCFTLDLVIGVNNSYICGSYYENQPCDGQAGANLANEVNTLNNELGNSGYSWQIIGKGGIDAEAFYGNGDYFGSYASTSDYANGYNSYLTSNHLGWNLYDYGAAATNCSFDWCNSGLSFTQRVYNLSWGFGYNEPFPEAYSTGANTTWNTVAQYNGGQGHLQFNVVMLNGANSTSTNQSLWQDFVNQNSTYIPFGVLSASVQKPLVGG